MLQLDLLPGIPDALFAVSTNRRAILHQIQPEAFSCELIGHAFYKLIPS